MFKAASHFHWFPGLVLSLTGLRMPALALVESDKILRNDEVHDEAVDGAATQKGGGDRAVYEAVRASNFPEGPSSGSNLRPSSRCSPTSPRGNTFSRTKNRP